MSLHLIKLCVGCDSPDELAAWRRERSHAEPEWRLHTRQTPKRAAEVVDGGSVYRVFKGAVLCRQRVLAINTVGEGRSARCEIVLDPELVRVAPAARRPFQGWRYLRPDEAPADMEASGALDALPPRLAIKLRELGAW